MGKLADILKSTVIEAARGGIEGLARDVLKDAQRQVPKGDSTLDPTPDVSLARSGVVVAVDDGVVIDFQTPYAAKQHEDLRLRHPRGGNARFLEIAVAQNTRAMQRAVGQAVRIEMAGSGDRRSRRRRDGVSRPGVGRGELPEGAAKDMTH